MTPEKWEKFSFHLETYAHSVLSSMIIHDRSTLNSAWTDIRKYIMDSANKYINNHLSSTKHKQDCQ
ncbi:hypothetical protein C1645_828080 [Glomus cerebriforme]|uniref:Uncharacterized protein n=1 Tax=Glomus cerebriforme TaxID=658196 RepID=A0A397SM95_9GLOM|nr:hypothetical protein C1645_828080 [Glomus cerebriforme]